MIVCLSYVAVQQHYNWEINRSVAIDAPLKGESARWSPGSQCLLTEQKYYSQRIVKSFFGDLYCCRSPDQPLLDVRSGGPASH